MTIHTQQSLSGFIASEPQQSTTENGETRFYVRIGHPQFRREASGSYTVLEPSFHDLVAYRATADRAMKRFAKGDNFIAEGYVRSFQFERDGKTVTREEFVAKKIGHDLARTNYNVDRTRHFGDVGTDRPDVAAQKASLIDTAPAQADYAALGI